MLHFIDFEVFRYDWLCVIANPVEKTETVIVNDLKTLRDYYNSHKDEIFIGYNIRDYDSWIFKGILAGFNPYEINDHIINKGLKGYQFSSTLREYPLINYDLIQLNTSLKQLEAFQGHSIYESEVDFRIDRKLTAAEIAETIEYCKNDVQETMNLFLLKKYDYDAKLELINEFKLPLLEVSKTNSQMIATILGAERRECTDEFNLNFPEYLNRIKKYSHIVDWFKDLKTLKNISDETKKTIYSQKLNISVAGCPHVFAWGGIHGALPQYSGSGYYLHIDVNSYYPSLMISHNYFSRSIPEEGKERFKMVKAENIRLKKFPELKKKRNAYKLVCNSTYGCFKDKYNALYDPLMANNICVTGQLALLLLIEMLEPYVQLIQSNTDGLIVKLWNLDDYEKVDDICYKWETLTGVKLAFDPIITKIYQKDVNNYLFVDEFGEVEAKGAYVKNLSSLDNDLPVVNKALREYMINGTPVEETINGTEDLIEFQKIFKLGGSYDYLVCGDKKLYNKCYRCFATKDGETLFKYKSTPQPRYDKVANTSISSVIINGDITDQSVPEWLDRQWYIEMAKDRLRQFGGN